MPDRSYGLSTLLHRSGWVPALALLWAGMLIGVSFIATPVKFLAPSLTLPVALDVGRQTFAVFGRIEVGLLIVLAIMVLFGERRRLRIVGFALLALLVSAEMLWLLPVLDANVGAIIAGIPRSSGPEHALYIGAEVVKLLTLVIMALWPHKARQPQA